MAIYDDQGLVRVSLSDGIGYKGLYAPDGSWYVTPAPGTEYVGIYAPDGSLYVTVSPGDIYVGIHAPDGSIYVNQSDTPDGSLKVIGLPATVILSETTVDEDAAIGTTVGTLSVIEGSGTYTFSITDDPDGKFSIVGTALKTTATLDYETAWSHSVTVSADNGVDDPTVRTFTIFVTDVDDTAPTVLSSNSVSVVENSQLSHTLTANEAVTWSIVGGADQGQFELQDVTLRWSSNGTRNYEAPADANTDNAYVVTVRATDLSSNTTDQTITVTVTDADEIAPTITSGTTGSVDEGSVLSFSLTANETVTWSLIGGADQSKFEISGSTLRWSGNGTKDYSAPDDSDTNNTYVVQIRATDSASNTTDQTVTITVLDVATGPVGPTVDITAGVFSVFTGYFGGVVGSVSSSTLGPATGLVAVYSAFTDPDYGLIVAFSGDKETDLSGVTTVWIDGQDYLFDGPFTYDGDATSSTVVLVSDPFTDTETYEIGLS